MTPPTIKIDVPPDISVFPTDPVYRLPILPVGTLLPRSMATRIPTKAPGQTFYTPPPPGWYAPFQATPLPAARSASPAPVAPAPNPNAPTGGANTAGQTSSSTNSWSNAAPNWVQPTYEQTQGNAPAPGASARNPSPAQPSMSQASTQAQTQRYMDWKKSQVASVVQYADGTTKAAPIQIRMPDPAPLIPASSSVTRVREMEAAVLANPSPYQPGTAADVATVIHATGNVLASEAYVRNASRDENAATAALADYGRRADLEAQSGGNPFGLPGAFFDTNRLNVSPIGNVTTKETYQRTVTVPVGAAKVPLQFTVPSAVPVLGGQTLKVETAYDVYTTDQGVRNVRVHDVQGAFQWAQDFSASYAPNQARAMDGGYGSPLAIGAYNAAQVLMGKPALSYSDQYWAWFPPATTSGNSWLANSALNTATALAYKDGFLGFLNAGANFYDSALMTSQALGVSSFDRIASMNSLTDFVDDALAVAGYSESIAIDAETVFGGVLGSASDAEIGALIAEDGATPAETQKPTDIEQPNQTENATAPAPASSEQVTLKAIIPPGPPEWGMAFKPDFPTVIGQDPAKRGVDVQAQAVLGACTVIWHHVVRETWTFCGKATCNCSVDNCEERETIREWDTTEYEPDQIGSVTVNTALSSSSVAYIQGPMQSLYPGATVFQGQVRVYPSEYSRGASQVVGIPTVWRFSAERIPYADPGSWDVAVRLSTAGTSHCGSVSFDQTFPNAFVTWLREQRMVK
jgi:hypothetical protein